MGYIPLFPASLLNNKIKLVRGLASVEPSSPSRTRILLIPLMLKTIAAPPPSFYWCTLYIVKHTHVDETEVFFLVYCFT